jgi:hypothetical protein
MTREDQYMILRGERANELFTHLSFGFPRR